MIGVLYLAQDLSFAYDEGVQTAGYQKQVTDAVDAGESVKVLFVKGFAGNAFHRIVQRFHAIFRFLGNQIQLRAVAGRKQDCFRKVVGLFQQPQHVFDPAAGKVEFFPDFHRGGLMVQPQYD